MNYLNIILLQWLQNTYVAVSSLFYYESRKDADTKVILYLLCLSSSQYI